MNTDYYIRTKSLDYYEIPYYYFNKLNFPPELKSYKTRDIEVTKDDYNILVEFFEESNEFKYNYDLFKIWKRGLLSIQDIYKKIYDLYDVIFNDLTYNNVNLYEILDYLIDIEEYANNLSKRDAKRYLLYDTNLEDAIRNMYNNDQRMLQGIQQYLSSRD